MGAIVDKLQRTKVHVLHQMFEIEWVIKREILVIVQSFEWYQHEENPTQPIVIMGIRPFLHHLLLHLHLINRNEARSLAPLMEQR